MCDKMECFYAAKEIIVANVALENDAIERLFKAKIDLAINDNKKLPPLPTYKTVDIDDIYILAAKIEDILSKSYTPKDKELITE